METGSSATSKLGCMSSARATTKRWRWPPLNWCGKRPNVSSGRNPTLRNASLVNSLACSFNFLTPETSFQANIWEGYATRTVREKLTGRRAARMVYEYLGENTSAVLAAARQSGLITQDEVPPFHLRLLRLSEEFR